MRHRPLNSLTRSRAFHALAFTSLVGFSSLLSGCSDEGSKNPNGDGTGGGSSNSGAIKLTEANNFTTVKSELHIPSIDTASATNLDVSWSGIQNDILCHPVNPAEDIDDVVFLRLKSTNQADIAAQLDSDQLDSGDLYPGQQAYEFMPMGGATTSAKLNAFAFNGTPLDLTTQFVQDPNSTYLMVFQKGTQLAHGAVAMAFVNPGGGSGTTVAAPPNAKDASGVCPLLTYQADFGQLTPVAVPKSGSVALDWFSVKHDSRKADLNLSSLNRMLIGFYANKTKEQLQADFLNLEISDTASWELKFDNATSATLNGAKNRKDGTNFTGFDSQTGTGTWIMGLFCDECSSPAPLFVTILQPT